MSSTTLRPFQAGSTGLIETLREAILEGRYAPGSRLVQEDLAETFGVSRIPLREALRRLEGEGLVEITRNRGAVVRALSPKDVSDLYDLRLALESLAIRRAAERRVDLRASTERRAAEALHAAATRSMPTLFHLDRDYHAELAAASDNPHLIAALEGQWSQIMRVMHAYLKTTSYPPDVWDDHQAIADAIADGDAETAIARLTSHLAGSRDHILAHLRATGELQ